MSPFSTIKGPFTSPGRIESAPRGPQRLVFHKNINFRSVGNFLGKGFDLIGEVVGRNQNAPNTVFALCEACCSDAPSVRAAWMFR